MYAEKTAQNWDKVIEHCEAVEAMGFKLVDDYGDMWGYTTSDANRNTTESVFEVIWEDRSQGHWIWRDLIAAYKAEGDTERANASIVYDEAGWSNYYPAEEYAFMHKCPTNVSSNILMRLGEIYLLHAEALAMTGDLQKATDYVNLIRNRAGIQEYATAFASPEDAIDKILHERRLELAFEGFRFWDLVRHDKIKEVHDRMPQEDPYWQPRRPMTDATILMPIPQSVLDNNPRLTQNDGY